MAAALAAGLLKRRSWMAVVMAVTMNTLMSHKRLEDHPQPHSYEELTAPLLDASRYTISVATYGKRLFRAVNAMATPEGPTGKTIVLVHDLKMRLETWSLVWQSLRESGHRIIAADMPGHGESNITAGCLQLASLAQDIGRVLTFFDVTQGVLVAHGLGGLLSIQYLLNEPQEAAKRLVGFACIACSAGNYANLGGTWGVRRAREVIDASGIKDLISRIPWAGEVILAKDFGNPNLPAVKVVREAWIAAASLWSLRNLSAIPWDADVHQGIPETIQLPSVLLVGSEDRVVPHPVVSEALQAAFSATGMLRSYRVLEGVGHHIPLVRPGAVVEEVEQLLRETD